MDPTRLVTRAVAQFVTTELATAHLDGPSARVCVGLSGGADSLALTAACLRAGLEVTALVVDHRLQAGSAEIAERAANAAAALGADAQVLTVDVGTRGGLEAAARDARYAALDAAREGRPVLLGHTADDQAETVLLGLARGSGARSIAGMRAWAPPWGRPLLGVRRAHTRAVCEELALVPHDDPHNLDPRFTRVRLRTEVLPLLDEVLHGGVVDALGRTAAALSADADALDEWARRVAATVTENDALDLAGLHAVPDAVRTRVLRTWLLRVGATEPTHRVVSAVDRLACAADAGERRAEVAVGGDPAVRRVVVRDGEMLKVRLTRR